MLLSFLKNWTLPVAIVTGSVLYMLFAFVPALSAAADILGPLCETLLPISIFCTLFVTFSKVDFHLMRLRGWHGVVLFTQLSIAALLTFFTYKIIGIDNFSTSLPLVAGLSQQDVIWISEAILVCIIAPCASASPVVTAKLGGDLTQMTTFVLLSSLVASLFIPIIFPLLEPHAGNTFLGAFLLILQRLSSVLLLPLLLGALVRHWVKPLYNWFLRTPDLGFYLWSVSLAITSGITVKNMIHSHASPQLLIAIAALTLFTAVVQFGIGRMVGQHFGQLVCSGQAMFQKNTGLAIWIAYVYLSPVASIGAGCYVLWQNIINSYELWQHRKSGAPKPERATTSKGEQKSTHL